MAVATYSLFVGLGLAASAFGLTVVAAILVGLAVMVAFRWELRWVHNRIAARVRKPETAPTLDPETP